MSTYEEDRDFVRQNCWLVNLTGSPGDFQAIDLVEEHTIKDIKVTYRPRGPNSSWELMKARAPAIPTLRAIDQHLTRLFGTLYRGTRHTVPSKEADVQLLADFYANARVHVYVPGRDAEDAVKEVVSEGINLASTTLIAKWLTRREVYMRSTTQRWPAEGPASNPAVVSA